MKVKARGDVAQISLAAGERELLAHLLPQVRELLLMDEHPLTRRLFPPAYANDVAAQASYRELVHDDLLARRLAAIEVLENSVAKDKIVLDDTGTGEWLQALNAVRLVLGTRLDVSEDDDPNDLDPDDEDFPLWQAYHALSYMLGVLVEALEP